jgi:hypothetical protein
MSKITAGRRALVGIALLLSGAVWSRFEVQSVAEESGTPVRVVLDGVDAIPGARVSNPAVSGIDPSRIDVVLDAQSSGRVPPEWATGHSPPAHLVIRGGGLPSITVDGAQAGESAESAARLPEWWLERRRFAVTARIELKDEASPVVWKVHWIEPTLVLPVVCRRPDGKIIASKVTDLWTCQTYPSRSDGVAYLVVGASSSGAFVVRPAEGAPILLERAKVRSLAERAGGVPLDLVAAAGAELRCRVRTSDSQVEDSTQVRGWVWDVATGALLDSREGTVASGLTFQGLGTGDVTVVAQASLKSGATWLGTWSGEGGLRDAEIALGVARYWYEEFEHDETGIRFDVGGASSVGVSFEARPADDLRAPPASVFPIEPRRVVPGRYAVRGKAAERVLDDVVCVVRQGVVAVVPLP